MSENLALTQEKVLQTSKENIILIDWFSMSIKVPLGTDRKSVVNYVIDLLGLNIPSVSWLELSGFYRYLRRIYFSGISICWDVAPSRDGQASDQTVLLEMSGSGCRSFETFSTHKDWFQLFSLILADPHNEIYHLTRLDIAYDDWIGLLDIQKMRKYCDKRYLVSKFSKCPINYDSFSPGLSDTTIYFGSMKSDVLFRCYNKAYERGRSDVDHWVRFELQLRDDYAFNFLQSYHMNNDIGKTFFGVLNNYMRFVNPSKTDSNKCRWAVAPFWKRFVQSLERISIFSQKDLDYNLFKLERFVFQQAGNAIDTYIKIRGIEDFQLMLSKRSSKLTSKYLRLIKSCEAAEHLIEHSNSIEETLSLAEEVGLL